MNGNTRAADTRRAENRERFAPVNLRDLPLLRASLSLLLTHGVS
jgi:hypothetical protein